ncbi:MAG: hypothetical protein ABI047_02625 [Jatrophihabitantaceae bacterium]
MRLLTATIATGLAATACAAEQSTTDSGAGPKGSVVAPSGSWGVVDPGVGSASGSAGTASSGPGAGSGAGSGSGWGSQQVDDRCPAELHGQYNTPQAKPVPSGIEVDWVLRCTVVELHGDHRRGLLIERSDSDPAALLRALRAPDVARDDDPCPAIAMVVPYFALVQPDGKRFVARMPLTACALPQAAAMQALNGLRFTVIAKKALP